MATGDLASLYLSQPRGKAEEGIFAHVDRASLRFYSYARHALYEGLKAMGAGSGDAVLLPRFICSDVLAPIHGALCRPVYYDVDAKLQSVDLAGAASARAVLAVNFFGFPQDLQPFRDYCQRTGACLIEDNSHGLFSRAEDGAFLGTRGELGLFSFRKTVSLVDGAGLYIGPGLRQRVKLDQLPSAAASSLGLARHAVKQLIVGMLPYVGTAPVEGAVALRRLVKGSSAPEKLDSESVPDLETVMPGPPSPSTGLVAKLERFPWEREVVRRRELFRRIHAELTVLPMVKPLEHELAPGVSPYLFPFFMPDVAKEDVQAKLAQLGLRLIRWPNLPHSERNRVPEFYHQIWGVPFLW